MVVLVAVLAGGLFYLRYSLRRTREATLKQDLVTMRMAIDNYTLEKQHGPRSLHDLVREHYLKEIPMDPFTGKEDRVLDLRKHHAQPPTSRQGNRRCSFGFGPGWPQWYSLQDVVNRHSVSRRPEVDV